MNIKYLALLSSMMAVSYTQAENFYVLGSVGQSRFGSGSGASEGALTSSAHLTVDDNPGSASRFDSRDLGYKLQFGYNFNQNFAVEGGYVDLGQQNYHVNFDSGSGHAKTSDNGLNIAALGIIPVEGPFSVFGKVGVIDAKVDYHLSGSDAGGSFADAHEKIKFSPEYGVGVMYSLNDVADLRVEAERFADLGKKSTTGENNVDLLSLGVSYRFN
jgi:OOP family OmpA-OmpF porin